MLRKQLAQAQREANAATASAVGLDAGVGVSITSGMRGGSRNGGSGNGGGVGDGGGGGDNSAPPSAGSRAAGPGDGLRGVGDQNAILRASLGVGATPVGGGDEESRCVLCRPLGTPCLCVRRLPGANMLLE